MLSERPGHGWFSRVTPHFIQQSRLAKLLDTEIDQFLFNGISQSAFEQFALRFHWLYSLYYDPNALKSKTYKKDEDLTRFSKFEDELHANGNNFEQTFSTIMLQYESTTFDATSTALIQDIAAFRNALDEKPTYFVFSVLRLKKTTEQMSICALSLYNLFKNDDFETSNVKMFIFAWKMLGFALKKDQSQGVKDKYNKQALDDGLREIQSNLLFLHHLSTLTSMKAHTAILHKASSIDHQSHAFRIHIHAPIEQNGSGRESTLPT